jgi:DNA-binding transcriptional LysR family regulator
VDQRWAYKTFTMAFTPLNALSSFIAVARHRSFAAAARHLGVSTSALSQSVRQLEARLGVTLLTRTSRTVGLTDAGQRLLENAGAAVDQALESRGVVRRDAGVLPILPEPSPGFTGTQAFVDVARELAGQSSRPAS